MMSSRGKLQVDTRTNALIVSDIPAYVAKVAAMAGDLDSRTPQWDRLQAESTCRPTTARTRHQLVGEQPSSRTVRR
jgi:type II secretory pathway component GspD/PulD (secretin)